ncbi:MAG: pentapeptide repeat-containing protein [Bauldia sp.]
MTSLARSLAPIGALLLALAGSPAIAQEPIPVWDFPLGTPAAGIPADIFTDPSCGTNGGPRGRSIGTFAGFALCPPEASGLHEIWFTYDDTLEYIGRAIRAPLQAARNAANQVGGHPVVYSLLLDEAGVVRGYRIVTDDHAEASLRLDAASVTAYLRALFGTDWACEDLPRLEGETAIDGIYIKRRCAIETDGVRAVLETRYYLRPGQAVIDAQGRPMENTFESSSRLDVVQLDLGQPALAVAPPPPAPTPAPTDQRATFLAGLSSDCPGCDLAGVDLRRRDLTDANLAGANLESATLHRAVLRGADLSGSNLRSANLNLADLGGATLAGADLTYALLFAASAAGADFSGVRMRQALAGEAQFSLANFAEADLSLADLGTARFNDATLVGANLGGAYLGGAVLTRADLTEATFDDVVAPDAIMRSVNLTGASLRRANLRSVDFFAANFTNANFAMANLVAANIIDTVRDGADFTGATMP